MNSLFFLFRLSNKMPYILKKVFFLLFYLLWPIKKPNVSAPQEYLNSIFPDNGKSSLCDCNVVKKNPKYDVQIIIPVYNVEKYLKECLDSIVNQKTQYRYCVVAVNDGSPDNSRKILAEYERYPNFKIIDQENKGLSGARNSGLKEIDAEYVLFVDSDDLLCDGAIESLVGCAKQTGVDIVQGDYSYFWNDGRTQKGRKTKKGFCSVQSLTGFAWGKLYKASLWRYIRFPERYLFEDTVNRIVLYNIAKTAFNIDKNVVLYRQNLSGITSTSVGNEKSIDSVWVTKKMIEDFLKLKLPITGNVCEVFLKQFMFNFSRILTMNNVQVYYASFLLYCKIIESINIDMSSYGYGIRIAYESLKMRKYKKFLMCSVFLR